jgi:putative transposase
MAPAHVSLRTGRHSIAGAIYLVTFTTDQRQPHFANWEVASEASRLMTTPLRWSSSRLLAWVLMPDHWHGLVAPGDDDTLAGCVGRLKGFSARMLRRRYPEMNRIWATAYHDRALRADEDLVTVARYVVMNPVRGGLVQRVGDYPFWDAVWIRGGARG